LWDAPLNLLLARRASVVQYLSVRGDNPVSFAGSPRTMSVSKRGPVVFPGVGCREGDLSLADVILGHMPAGRARRIY
jgi:hypothetical protein